MGFQYLNYAHFCTLKRCKLQRALHSQGYLYTNIASPEYIYTALHMPNNARLPYITVSISLPACIKRSPPYSLPLARVVGRHGCELAVIAVLICTQCQQVVSGVHSLKRPFALSVRIADSTANFSLLFERTQFISTHLTNVVCSNLVHILHPVCSCSCPAD